MRIIDADALEREYQERYKFYTWDDGEREKATLARVIQRLHAQPTIEERKRGEWIDKSNGIEGAWNYCSVCGEQAIDLYDFCPNCGADMRGERDDD